MECAIELEVGSLAGSEALGSMENRVMTVREATGNLT